MRLVDNVEIESILEEMERLIANASRVPLSGKLLVDGDAILECLDKIYAKLPEELKHAKDVLNQSDKLLESMESQGKRIIEEARQQAAALLIDSEIYKEAQFQAEQMRLQAEAEAQNLRKDAVAYAEDVLQQLEMNLEKAVITVRKSREDLRTFR
jgi:vacuolar-type H+-ATPase subunit H